MKRKIKGVEKDIPIYLEKPELVFAKIWATPADGDEEVNLKSLID
ncbi:MAG: hypothetical protein ABR566_17645 [Pyrinomonadaceae bacterium]